MNKAIMLKPDLFDSEKYGENEIEEAAETLLKAEEIKKDETLMKNVDKYLAAKKEKITSLSQLKEKAHNFVNKKDEDSE